MLNVFRKKSVLDSETTEWEMAVAGWVLESFGGLDQIRQTEMVLPNAAFFPTDGEEGEALAKLLFRHVLNYAQMEDWPVLLEPMPESVPTIMGDVVVERSGPPKPAGLISLDSEQSEAVLIKYDPGLVGKPYDLISTFAHELAHYLMWSAKKLPPGGMALHEQSTDALAVHMGFGIFMVNSAYTFSAWNDSFSFGWSSTRLGYLTQRQLLYAIAIFLRLKGGNPEQVSQYIGAPLQKLWKKSFQEIDDIPDLEGKVKQIWEDYPVTDEKEI